MLNKVSGKVLKIINSRGFFWFVIGFFIFEAAWIALTAAYPQAFDEQFHFGLIKIYSYHLSPFLAKQPAGGNAFGAVARDPSYLYHYLMSFPYRLIELFTKLQSYQVIALRFIDIFLFAYGFILFKKILIRTKVSSGYANLAILIFALIPIVPQLAGQINYDDLLFPLVAFICLLSFKLIDEIKKLKPSFRTVFILLITAVLTSLVKYAFLPIFLSIIVFFAFYLLWTYRTKLKIILANFISSFKKESLILKTVLIAGLVLSVFMFAQRDVVNLINYHTVDPNCSSVLSVNQCTAYSAWYANYERHIQLLNHQIRPSSNFIVYIFEWLYWMWYRLFFAVNGPASGFTNYPPLPVPCAIALIIGLFGFIAAIKFRKELFKANPYSTLMLIACAFYIIALILQGYSTYRYTATLENMNGRYLLPVLLLTGAVFVKAFSLVFRKYSHLKVIIACVIVLMFLEGGGILTYINRSDNSWYFQNSKVIKANEVAKKITKKVVVGGKKSYSTNVWFFN
jgi:hypothetical protein